MHLAATSVERRGIMGCVRNGYISIFAVVFSRLFYFFYFKCVQQEKKKRKPIESAHKEKHSYISRYLICFFLYVVYSWLDQLSVTVSKG